MRANLQTKPDLLSNGSRKHLKVGITGGIGVGKSTVCSIFRHFGIPVYSADDRAKFLMNKDPQMIKHIRQAFGWDAYDRNDKLNRAYLSKIVFNDPRQLKILNSIVHPAVYKDYSDWVEAHEHLSPYSIKEAAIMLETDSYKLLDKIIVITSPINTRIERIIRRDYMKREEVLKRIQNQMSDKERLEKANFVIRNDGKHSLIEQCLKIHKELSLLCCPEDLATMNISA